MAHLPCDDLLGVQAVLQLLSHACELFFRHAYASVSHHEVKLQWVIAQAQFDNDITSSIAVLDCIRDQMEAHQFEDFPISQEVALTWRRPNDLNFEMQLLAS